MSATTPAGITRHVDNEVRAIDLDRDCITLRVDGANFVINVAGDSPAGVVADIFRQLGPAIHKVVY